MKQTNEAIGNRNSIDDGAALRLARALAGVR